MKKLEWHNGKYSSLGKDEQGDIPVVVVKKDAKTFIGIIMKDDLEQAFETLEEAQEWCEAYI